LERRQLSLQLSTSNLPASGLRAGQISHAVGRNFSAGQIPALNN
jgi:hypothetical protein